MFGLGTGKDNFPLHHPEYNFPDELIQIGADIFIQVLYNKNADV